MHQKQVNSLKGALGPTTSTNWESDLTMTGEPYNLSSQPLVYSKNKYYSITVPKTSTSFNVGLWDTQVKKN